MFRYAGVLLLMTLGVTVASAPVATAQVAPPKKKGPNFHDTLPEAAPPAWPEGYRYRLTVKSINEKPPPAPLELKSIMVKLPIGSLLRPDGADVLVKNDAGKVLPVAVLTHDPLGDTVIQFPREGGSWYYIFAGNPDIKPKKKAPKFNEGITVEVRSWAGDNLDSWTTVRDGLEKSDNVIGSGITAHVLQNCNPARPSETNNFAASYRGSLVIEKPGPYRFFVNADDASFLFIDGIKVVEKTGTNRRMGGKIKADSVGVELELKEGVHPFEVHHVVGTNPNSVGYCALMWMPPGEKLWTFVPRYAFTSCDLGHIAALDAREKESVAVVSHGIDDVLFAGGLNMFLVRFTAQGSGFTPDKVEWDFGDGCTGKGVSPTHVYFRSGNFTVSVKSPDGTVAKRSIHLWPVPGTTSPFTLQKAIRSLTESNWKAEGIDRVQRIHDFLTLCDDPERYPLLEAMCRRLLEETKGDLQTRGNLYATLMEALAEQGKAREALKLLEVGRAEMTKLPSQKVHLDLTAADIHARHMKEPNVAIKLLNDVLENNRRLEQPVVRVAAIRLGDLIAEGGDLARASEIYRVASALGGEKFRAAAQTEAIQRGAMLRMAEQKLKNGDVRQSRLLLQKMELEYPEEKLEGLYRFLRAEADRYAGRYEDSIRGYEVLLKLTQWAGYRDKALYGIGDCFQRMGDLEKTSRILTALKESFKPFYDANKLKDYHALVDARLARQVEAKKVGKKADELSFKQLELNFEPGEDVGTPVHFKAIPGLGLFGPGVGLCQGYPIPQKPSTYYFDLSHPVENIEGQGNYWAELWYRDVNMAPQVTSVHWGHCHVSINGNGVGEAGGLSTVNTERTFGEWRKMAFRVRAPLVQDGKVHFTIRLCFGMIALDHFTLRPVTDRQLDLLTQFQEGEETP